MRFSVLFTALTLAFTASACGASAVHGPEHVATRQLPTDNDRYADAFAEAFRTYEAEVEMAVSHTYASESEAFTVARSMNEAHFGRLLERALNHRGLTLHGFEQQRAHHPELEATLHQRFDTRILEVRASSSQIASRVTPHTASTLVAFDQRSEDVV